MTRAKRSTAVSDVKRSQAIEDTGRIWSTTRKDGQVVWYAELFGWRACRRTEDGAKATLELMEARFQGLTKSRVQATATPEKVTVSVLLHRYLKRHRSKVRETTFEVYRRWVKHVRRYLGQVYVYELTPDLIERWVDSMRTDKLGTSQQKYAFSILKTAVRWAVVKKWIHMNPLDYVDTPTHRNADPRDIYTPDEIARLIKKGKCKKYRVMLMTMFHLGLRAGEICALRWDDVDIDAGIIRIRRQARRGRKWDSVWPLKSRAGRRDLAMPPALKEAWIDFWKYTRKRGFCFTPTKGKTPLRRDIFREEWVKVHRRAKVRYRNPHTARHTCASLAIEHGATIPEVAKLLGHANPAMTARVYSHVVDSSRHRVAAAMQRALG